MQATYCLKAYCFYNLKILKYAVKNRVQMRKDISFSMGVILLKSKTDSRGRAGAVYTSRDISES